MTIDPGTPILVTTAHRGVFFGRFKEREDKNVTVTEARNCISWTQQERGFLGLASEGPGSGCRSSALMKVCGMSMWAIESPNS